jgi:hypothetical protein
MPVSAVPRVRSPTATRTRAPAPGAQAGRPRGVSARRLDPGWRLDVARLNVAWDGLAHNDAARPTAVWRTRARRGLRRRGLYLAG